MSPSSGVTFYSYDPAGNVLTKTDAKGIVTRYQYDALNRLTDLRIEGHSNYDVHFRYDEGGAVGKLTSMTDHQGEVSYSYDDRGLLTSKSRTMTVFNEFIRLETKYRWNAEGQLSTLIYPAGLEVRYEWDGGQVVGVFARTPVNDAEFIVANGIRYQPFGGSVAGLTWGNGIDLERSYDLDGRRARQKVGYLQDALYGYDLVSNIIGIDDSAGGSQSFSYDRVGRLVEAWYDDDLYGAEYTYDAVGNRADSYSFKSESGNRMGSRLKATYEADSNRFYTINNEIVQYDENGNMLDRPHRRGRMEYSPTNRLEQLYSSEGVLWEEYAYNGMGERIRKALWSNDQTHKNTEIFQYGLEGQVLEERRVYHKYPLSTTDTTYIWLGGIPLASVTYKRDISGGVLSTRTTYIHSNHLNTPVSATNETQEVVWHSTRDMFGFHLVMKRPLFRQERVKLAMPGQLESGGGLLYNYYRDYDPSLGRYIFRVTQSGWKVD